MTPSSFMQDLLGRPRLLERRGVDHPQQGRDQELVREDRELPDEVGELGVRRLSVAEPARVGVVGDDRGGAAGRGRRVQELAKRLHLCLGQLAAAAAAPRSAEKPGRDAALLSWVIPLLVRGTGDVRPLHRNQTGNDRSIQFQDGFLPAYVSMSQGLCYNSLVESKRLS